MTAWNQDQLAERASRAARLAAAVDGGPMVSEAGVRELTRQAAALGVTASVLNVAHALHTQAMMPGAAPLRSVLAQVRFGPPRRRLVSTVTARELTPQDDIAAVLCAQLTSPVRFREALQAASDGADLIFLAGADEALVAAAAACGVPVAGFPAGRGLVASTADGGLLAPDFPAAEGAAACAAALFTAGVMPDAAALDPGPAEPAGIVPDRPVSPARTPLPLVTPPEPAPAPGRFMENVTMLPGSGPPDAYLLPPEVQPAGVAAHLQAVRPAPVPQQQVESLSRAR